MKLKWKNYKWPILIALSTVVLGVLVLDAPYLIARFKHLLQGEPPPVETITTEMGEPNRLIIESLGISAPIVITEAANETEYQEALAFGVVHYPGSAKIGEVGNAYLFGHSSDFIWKPGDYKTVFALLPEIETGAVVTATDEQGRVFRYKVYETLVVQPNDFSVLNQDTGGKKILSLQTSYPVGTALRRFIVRAEIVE